MSTPKFAHVVFRTSQPESMASWYCDVLQGHVVYGDDALTFITFDEEHHRVALIHPPTATAVAQSAGSASMHHTAYTFDDLDSLLDRYSELLGKQIEPAVCINHGVTTSMYYQDPDGHFVEMQIDNFVTPDEATAYMHGPEYAADSVGPAFDPNAMLAARQAGATLEVLTGRAWSRAQDLPDPMQVLLAER